MQQDRKHDGGFQIDHGVEAVAIKVNVNPGSRELYWEETRPGCITDSLNMR